MPKITKSTSSLTKKRSSINKSMPRLKRSTSSLKKVRSIDTKKELSNDRYVFNLKKDYSQIKGKPNEFVTFSYIKTGFDDVNENERKTAIKLIIDLDKELRESYNSQKVNYKKTFEERLKVEINKLKINNQHLIVSREKELTEEYLDKLQDLKYNLINQIIEKNKLNIKNLGLTIDSITIPKIKSINKLGGAPIRYKNLDKDESTNIIDDLCGRFNNILNPHDSVLDFINSNPNERIRKDRDLNDVNVQDVFNADPTIQTKKVSYDVVKVDLDQAVKTNHGVTEREFKFQKYSQELVYYTESKIIDENELINEFTNSHIDYLLTLQSSDKFTINDYTRQFYTLLNEWKANPQAVIDRIFDDLTTVGRTVDLDRYLDTQLCKALNNYGQLAPNFNPATDINFLTNQFVIPLRTFLRAQPANYNKQILTDIFTQYDIDLNRIIAEAPPRIYSIDLIRGSSTDYVFNGRSNFFRSNRFSSFTIDVFRQIGLGYSMTGGTSTIYDCLISPTAKILFVAPVSQYHYELEIIQASNQVLCRSIDDSKTKIYVYRPTEDFQDPKILCTHVPGRETVFVRKLLIT